MSEQVIEVKNLVTEFKTPAGTLRAVNGVDFSVKRGHVLGIVGESGCGKSVTSLSLMGLLDKKKTVRTGEILFEGRDLLKLNEKEMRKIRGNEIAMIFQEPMTALNPVFTIGFQLGEVIRLHKGVRDRKKIREEAVQMLERVGIPDPGRVAGQYPHQLSGGMRQRVMIAMALLCSPKLLIADEPTTALDVTIQAQVLELIGKLKDEYETGVLFITHDLGVIAQLADEVMVMYGGRVMERASVQQIFAEPRHPYTIGLMNSRTDHMEKGKELACIPGTVPTLKDLPKHACPFATRCKYATERCLSQIPPLTEVSDGHEVGCFFASDEKKWWKKSGIQ